jgi:hypothetical protein
VTPVECRLERLLARRGRAAACAEQAEAIVEATCKRGRGECADAGSCKLERQREPVEAVADPRHGRPRLSVERESRCDGVGSLDEQPNRLMAQERLRVVLALRVGNSERRDAEENLARNTQRLTTRGENGQPGRTSEERIGEGCGGADEVLTVVEHEQELEGLELGHQSVDDGTAAQRSQIEPLGDRSGDEPAVVQCVQLDEQHAVGIRVFVVACQRQRQARLAHTAGTGERQQPRMREQGGQLAELVLPTHERGRLDRERTKRGRRCGGLLDELGEQLPELCVQTGEALSLERRPVVVAVLGEKLAAVQRESTATRRSASHSARLRSCVLELLDVELRLEPQDAVEECDGSCSERSPRCVHRLIEVVRSRGGITVRPELVHGLLAMEAMPVREREQLHELLCLAQPPRRVRDGRPARLDREASQQRYTRLPLGCHG